MQLAELQLILGLNHIVISSIRALVSTAAAARLADSTGIEKQMVFGKDKAINRFYDLVMRGHFLSMCIRENCNAEPSSSNSNYLEA